MQNYLSVDDVTRLCHITEGTIRYWMDKGNLSFSRSSEGSDRIHADDLVRCLQRLRLRIPDELCVEEKLKILIVDDEPALRRILRLNLLGLFPGIRIEESGEGLHAGWRTTDFIPDILILDLIMPGMDGFELCHLLRNNPALQETRIIVITALKESEAKEKVFKLGANDFLSKPFTMSQLREAILRQLESSPGEIRYAG